MGWEQRSGRAVNSHQRREERAARQALSAKALGVGMRYGTGNEEVGEDGDDVRDRPCWSWGRQTQERELDSEREEKGNQVS